MKLLPVFDAGKQSPSISSSTSVSYPSIFLTNARSVFPKIDELRVSVDALAADLIAITESWLHDDIYDDLLHIRNYDFFRCDRQSRKGGGVCVWAKCSFSPRALSMSSPIPSCIELIFLRLSCTKFSLLFCTVFVSPGLPKADQESFTDFLTFEIDNLLVLHPNDKLVVAGDLNDFPTAFLIENFNLVNRVTEATRKSAILDHIWIGEELCVAYPSASVGPPLKSSDHNSILLFPMLVSFMMKANIHRFYGISVLPVFLNFCGALNQLTFLH